MWKNPEIYVIVAKRWSKIGKKQEISGKMWKFPGKLQKIWISRQKSADFLRKSPSETVLINLKAHQRRCKSLLKPHRRRWNFKKFWKNVEIPRKMWKFPEKFSKKQVFLGNSQKNVEIPWKCGNFLRKRPSETVLINLKAHRRRCKSLVKPRRRRWNFKKFEFPAKNRLIF